MVAGEKVDRGNKFEFYSGLLGKSLSSLRQREIKTFYKAHLVSV